MALRVAAARLLGAFALTCLPVVATAAPASADGTRRDVDRYLDSVADTVRAPGVFVDPAVLDDGKLTSDDVATLERRAAQAPGPVRLLVLPVEELRVDRGGVTSAELAYRPAQLVKQIYRRVDRAGTYAVLVSADSRDEGQSFYAYQWARGGKTYDIEDAADRAIACCAPDYAPMLRRFLKEADDPLRGGGSGSGGGPIVALPEETAAEDNGESGPGLAVFGVVAAAAAAVGGLAFVVRRRTPSGSGLDPDTSASLRTSFGEEIEELRQRVGSMGPALTGNREAVDTRIAGLRTLLDQAHGRLTSMRSAADAQAVARMLADARFELAAAQALRDNRPAPTRTPPCFVDPRHGLSVATMAYPASGLTTPVPVCAACRAELEAGQEPRPRMLSFRGSWTNHWLAAAPAWVYLHGYWAGQPFMHQHFATPPAGWATAPAGPGADGATGVEAPDSGGGRGFGGFGGRRGGGGDAGSGGGGFGGGHGGGGGF